MNNPYKTTILNTTVSLQPRQMNNEVYLNLKNNLIEDMEGKCFKDYGFITEVFEITKEGYPRIRSENLRADAEFDVEFSCRICKPIPDDNIICKVERVNKLLMKAQNGPIIAIIPGDRINDDHFFHDKNRNLQMRLKDGKSKLVEPGDLVIVNINRVKFVNGDNQIKTICFLERMATEEERKDFAKQQFSE